MVVQPLIPTRRQKQADLWVPGGQGQPEQTNENKGRARETERRCAEERVVLGSRGLGSVQYPRRVVGQLQLQGNQTPLRAPALTRTCSRADICIYT